MPDPLCQPLRKACFDEDRLVPVQLDRIKIEQLYEAIKPITGECTLHFKGIEQALRSNKISTKKIIETVICPIHQKIYKEIAEQKPTELQEVNYEL